MLKEIFTVDLACATRVVGHSMIPTLKNHQICIYNPFSRKFRRGDIVIAETDTAHIVKRIIAVEGEHIHISRNGSVTVNEKRLDEPYIFPQSRPGKIIDTVVPSGHVWLMGDNRGASTDSRERGAVHTKYILGKLILRKRGEK